MLKDSMCNRKGTNIKDQETFFQFVNSMCQCFCDYPQGNKFVWVECCHSSLGFVFFSFKHAR